MSDTDLSAADDAAMHAQMSETDVISLSVLPPLEDIFITCPQCGRRVSIYNHLCDMGSGGTSPLSAQHEPQPIALDQCVKECQKVSAEFHAAMKRLGVEQ